MTEPRKEYGPHYIAELDPENPNRPPTVTQPWLLGCVIGGMLSVLSALGLWYFDYKSLAVGVALLGMLFLTPFWIAL